MRLNFYRPVCNTNRNLNLLGGRIARSAERLSSGYLINRAADDPAGNAYATDLSSDIRSLGVAERNALDAVSKVQTADAATQEVTDMLQRMRELAVEASGESDGTEEQAELDELVAEINDIDSSTEFAGDVLFDGAARTFQVGANSGDTIDVTFQDVDASTLGGDHRDRRGPGPDDVVPDRPRRQAEPARVARHPHRVDGGEPRRC